MKFLASLNVDNHLTALFFIKINLCLFSKSSKFGILNTWIMPQFGLLAFLGTEIFIAE